MQIPLSVNRALITGWLILFCLPLFAQQKYTISGYVQDASNGEKLISAKVYDEKSLQGTLTNNFGFFSLTLEEGPINLVVAYTGYKSFKLEFELKEDATMTFDLDFYELEEVEIVAEQVERIEEKTEMSTIDVPIKQIKMLPALLGEVDVIKAIQLLPGVQSGSEGSTGLYVRGGGPDQNLILLDDVPLYYVSHLGGFFSVFNADAISSVKLVKGGFPARYGGRLSSVLDIRMKEGNNQEFHGEGSLGLISSKLSLQGPIKKHKTSFIISGRRTYLDLLTRPLVQAISRNASEGESAASFGYYFYDLNGKVNHIFSEKDRLYFSFYLGDDNLGLSVGERRGDPGDDDYEEFELSNRTRWGNKLAALRWNHIWSPQLFSNVTATFTNYRFDVDNEVNLAFANGPEVQRNDAFLGYQSGIRDIGAKIDFDYYPTPNHDIKFGANVVFHKFTPGLLGFRISDQDTALIDTTIASQQQNAIETSVYVEDKIKVGRRFSANIGVHGVHYYVNEQSNFSIQPRASARFLLSDRVSLKGSYVQMTQFIHLLANSGTGLPVDLWVPATDRVPAQRSWQAALGIATTVLNDKLEISLEGYYKKMDGLIEYKEGTNFFLGIDEGDWQDRVETGGQGWAYGAELLVQKKTGATTGWIGYTLSWNNRQFENINEGNIYPFRFDRRHDISIVVAHRFSERVSVSGTWVYGTGNAITLPSGGYASAQTNFSARNGLFGSFLPIVTNNSPFGQGVQLYENGRNGFRMQAYHRLDLGVNFTKEKKWGSRTWNFGVYNAYNRLNPYIYYFGVDDNFRGTGTGETVLKKLALFPVIPSISYSFKF